MIPKIIQRNCLLLIGVIALMLIFLNVPTECHGDGIIEIGISVAPNTLNIQSPGQVVTVHTSITYGSVDHENVYLNGIQINSWKADSRVYFVAKFLLSEVNALADTEDFYVPGENEFTLVVYSR